jgi:hypothetical protein
MSSWLCRAFGCVKKLGLTRDYVDEVPDVSLEKSKVKLHGQKTRREDCQKLTASQVQEDIPEIVLSNGSSKSEIPEHEISMISKESRLRLEFYWNNKITFEHYMNVDNAHQNITLKYRILDHEWPKDFLDRFSMLAEHFKIKNKSEGNVYLQGLASTDDSDPFFWKPDQKMVALSSKGYKWLPQVFDRFIFKRLHEPFIVKTESVLAYRGNVLRLAVGPSGIAIAYISPQGCEKKVWKPEENLKIKAGRMHDCEIQLTGSNCSRYQLTITFQSGEWVVLDGYHDAKPDSGLWILHENKEDIICIGDQYIVGGFKVKVLDSSSSDAMLNWIS